MMAGDFVAEWPGWCPECDSAIREGDVCRYNEADQVCHEECLTRQTGRRAPLAVCPRCHLTRPCEHD